MKKSSNWQKPVLITLCVVLSVVLIGLIFATAYVHHVLNMMGRTDETYNDTLSPEDMATATETIDPDYTGPTVDPTDVTLDVLPTIPDSGNKDDSVVNILLVGQDRREGEPRQRSDVMMLVTFNTSKNTITLTSFMRDTYVYIPGYRYSKLNAAFCWGGFSLLNETLAVNFGVHVDANVEVDFYGFTDIIDLLGGVDIELTQKEADYMNEHLGFEYNQNEVWNLKAGWNHLNGDQALAYSRIRKLDSDFGRTNRQRKVLTALLNAYKNQGLSTMLALVDDILPMVTTNMTNQEILKYVVDLFPMISTAELNTQSIPTSGTYTSQTISGAGACLVPDLAANRAILEELFNAGN